MGSVGVGSFNIIDIRKEDLNHNLVNEIQAPLNPSEDQERRFPPIWLSYGPDLKTAEETHSNDWYPTDTELRIVEQTAKSIASIISQNIQLIELGKGYVMSLFCEVMSILGEPNNC